MGHNPPKPPPGFQPTNVSEAHWLGQPVVIYCLDCAGSRQASSWTVLQRRGGLPFGTLQGGFWCRRCGRSAVVVVLPWSHQTPRDWARAKGARAPSDDEQRKMLVRAEQNMTYRVDRWNVAGQIEQVIARVSDLEVARASFLAAKTRYPSCWYLTLREGVTVLDQHGQAAAAETG